MSRDSVRYEDDEIELAVSKSQSAVLPTPAIVIAASFVAEPLEAPLLCVLAEAGLNYSIGFAPYNQVFQQLLTPGSEIARNAAGISVLVVRLEDFVRDRPDTADRAQISAQISTELGDAIAQYAKRAAGALIVAVLCPGPSVDRELFNSLTESTHSLSSRLIGIGGVHLLQEDRIQGFDDSDRYDAARDELAHVPYSDSYFASLALALARKIHALRVPSTKVLALDCDNTLWRGVVGEDGVDGIVISTPYAAVQEFAASQIEKGILVCLLSKNVESDVLEVFERRSEMLLRPEHIVAHRINWLSKPTNLKSLASELNLGLDSFVFLDDNPVECAQMRAELPQVITIQVPPEEQIRSLLDNLWTFDKVATTSEDAKRTQMYRENSARKALESSAENINQFLAALDLKIDIDTPSDDEWTRIEQLGQRTNQFNFTTHRRTIQEFKSMIAGGSHVFRVRVSDRFGDYGLVGEIAAVAHENTLLVDTLLLSCRVLGRGVEHAMMRRLGEIAEAAELDAVVLPYIATARNVPARAFADSVASQFVETTPNGIFYRIPASVASRIMHTPGHDPAEIVQARLADEMKGAASTSANASGRSERYSRLANLLTSGSAVLDVMSSRRRRTRAIAGTAASPSSRLEAQMLQLWEEILETEGIGVDDDFFSLGGTSLLSVKLFAEIARRFGSQLRLTTILDAPTVRLLALQVDSSAIQARSGVVLLRPGGARALFLVHDGFGETLLYLNLAKLLPLTISIYGIEPKRLPGIPLAHSSFEDMADFYVDQIRSIQPRGPYLLGGMCAGGVIAYEMAACLQRQGEHVQLVTIFDGATPQAAKRSGLMTRHRLSRLEGLVAGAKDSAGSAVTRWTSIAAAVVRKAFNAAAYEVSSAARKVSVRMRFALIKNLIRRNAAWPKKLPELSVMEIYNALESQYEPPSLADVPILLVRASAGDGIDTPYRHLYQDDDLGWRRVAKRLTIVDVIGGHSSMLQQQAVQSLAATLSKQIATSVADPLSR